jgi:8-oxo-dGTP diphosphatase
VPPEVVVVAAVIEQNDAFLVTRRQAGVHLAGLWEFPGGKIDPDETRPDALKREISEELDVNVEVQDLVFHTSHDYPDRTVALYFYRCVLKGTPRPLLGQEMRWVPRSELPTLGFLPADEELIRQLVVGRP